MKKTIDLPCEIGDTIWTTRSYRGKRRPRRGTVSEMWFSPDMRLIILVKGISRGEWGKSVFATKEEAEKFIDKERRFPDEGYSFCLEDGTIPTWDEECGCEPYIDIGGVKGE